MDFHACHNNTITNLNIQDCGWGIKFFGDSATDQGGNNVVTNVVVRDSTVNSDGDFTVKREHNSSFSNINIFSGANKGLTIDGSNYLTFNNVQIDKNSQGNYPLKIDDLLGDVHHVTINGGFAKNPHANFGCLSFDEMHNVSINNFDFLGANNDNYVKGIRDCRFSGCSFSESTYGLIFADGASSHFIIDGCRFIGNSVDAIDTTQIACHNYSIVNSIFDHNVHAIDMHETGEGWVFLLGVGMTPSNRLSFEPSLRLNLDLGTFFLPFNPKSLSELSGLGTSKKP